MNKHDTTRPLHRRLAMGVLALGTTALVAGVGGCDFIQVRTNAGPAGGGGGGGGGGGPLGAATTTDSSVFHISTPSSGLFVAPQNEVPPPTVCRVMPRDVYREHEGGGNYGEEILASGPSNAFKPDTIPCDEIPKKTDLASLYGECTLCLGLEYHEPSGWRVIYNDDKEPIQKVRPARLYVNRSPGTTSPDSDELRKVIGDEIKKEIGEHPPEYAIESIIVSIDGRLPALFDNGTARMFTTLSLVLADRKNSPDGQSYSPRDRLKCNIMYEIDPLSSPLKVVGEPRCSPKYGNDESATFESGSPCTFDATTCEATDP